MIKSVYLNNIVYYIAGIAAVLFAASYFWPALQIIAQVILLMLVLCLLTDLFLLYSNKKGFTATRETGDRFSLGDENKVLLFLRNNYPYQVKVSLIDELPAQFQERNWLLKTVIAGGESRKLEYLLKPFSRGEYVFNDINVYLHGPLLFVKRRYVFPSRQTVKVYPSYLQMRKYHLLAVTNRLQELGVRKVRRIGHSMEFEQIKEYVRGDDYRTINWKATARKDALMVNSYTDERSQQI